MPDGKIVNWRFPLKGLNTAAPYRNQQEGTSPDLANVRAFDIVEGEGDYRERRARGGQRGGYELLSSVTGEVLDVVTLMSNEADGGVYLCIATTEGFWIGDDLENLEYHSTDSMPDSLAMVPYKGNLYVPSAETLVPEVAEPTPPPLEFEEHEPGATPITNWAELAGLADHSGYFYLANNLDSNTEDYEGIGDDWTPIHGFTGTLWCEDKSISDLVVNKPEEDEVGFFDVIRSRVLDVELKNINITGASDVGGLCGAITSGADIDRCRVEGSVNASGRAGGIVGFQSYGKAYRCVFEGSLTSTGDYVGGYAGQCHSEGFSVLACAVDATIKGNEQVGGFIGRGRNIYGRPGIRTCTVRGSVEGSHNVGGFIGWQLTTGKHISNPTNCSTHASVTITTTGNVGGWCGYMRYSARRSPRDMARLCYATGAVTAPDGANAGGFVGWAAIPRVLYHCAFDKDTTGKSNWTGWEDTGWEPSGQPDIPALSTNEMQILSTFDDMGWDIVPIEEFDNEDPSVWYIDAGNDYPRLWIESPGILHPIDPPVPGGYVWNPKTGWDNWIVNAGVLPQEAKIATVFRQRVVLSGVPGSDRHWYMSRVDDPLDWSLEETDSSAAISGSEVGETITALAPIRDDYLVIGCKTSIYIMVGDPMAGGTIETVSGSVGIYSSTAWCVDDRNNLYFTDGHDFYTFNAQEGLQNLSVNVAPRMFEGFEGEFEVDMTWDPVHHGIYIVQSSVAEERSRGWFVDMRTMGLFPDTYSGFFPLRTTFFDTEESDSRSRLEVADGNVVRQADGITTDLGSSIDSYVVYPPKRTIDEFTIGILRRIWAVLDENSGDITLEIMKGDTFQEAASAPVSFEVTLKGGGRQQQVRRRLRAPVVALKVAGGKDPWAIETVFTESRPSGRQK